MTKTDAFYQHAKEIMPGGVGLLSKRPEMFAPHWPGHYTKAKGCEIWDMDGKRYYDMTTNGIGACLLGYADPDVSAAVCNRVLNGSMSSLNAAEEVLLADKLIEIHPWAESVRFARTGGEICSIAVRIARATTGRDVVAICGYHGWADWYVAANLGDSSRLNGIHLTGLEPVGVPKALAGTAVPFHHGSVEEFDKVIAEYGDRLACVIMEPARNNMPEMSFMEHVKAETHRVGALLVYDEVTIAWRNNYGGIHKLIGIEPDIAIFAKALGNGTPIAAVIGTKAAMDGANDSFISSTYWTEGIGPTAALATLEKMAKVKVWEHIDHVGTRVMNTWETCGKRHGLNVHTSGFKSLAHFAFEGYDDPAALKTLYTAKMLNEGFLGNTAMYPTLAHTDAIMDQYDEAIDKVFGEMADIIKKGGMEAVREAIGGPVCQSDFKRLID